MDDGEKRENQVKDRNAAGYAKLLAAGPKETIPGGILQHRNSE